MASKLITFRLNAEDNKEFNDFAAASHIGLSAWIRQSCKMRIESEKSAENQVTERRNEWTRSKSE